MKLNARSPSLKGWDEGSRAERGSLSHYHHHQKKGLYRLVVVAKEGLPSLSWEWSVPKILFEFFCFIANVVFLQSLIHIQRPSKSFPGVAPSMVIELLVPFQDLIDFFFTGYLSGAGNSMEGEQR